MTKEDLITQAIETLTNLLALMRTTPDFDSPGQALADARRVRGLLDRAKCLCATISMECSEDLSRIEPMIEDMQVRIN